MSARGDDTEPDDDDGRGGTAKGSSSAGECGGEAKMPGGYGRGPRRMVFSSAVSWACWWRMLCLRVEMFWRMATVGGSSCELCGVEEELGWKI